MNSTAIEHEDVDFSPAPPTRAEREHDDRVEFLLDQLERAGRGEHTAWCLRNVLNALRHPRASVLSPRQRDEMLRATGIAHLAARRVFPETYSREQIDVGMGALAGLIVFWSEYIEQIEARPDDQRSDVYDFARKFENDCHNLCLDEQIDERASARRAAAPRTFLAAAREAIAA